MKKKGLNTIIECAKNTLGLAILGRRIRTREMEYNASTREENKGCIIVKFFAIVCLEGKNWTFELCGHICMERDKGGEDLGLAT